MTSYRVSQDGVVTGMTVAVMVLILGIAIGLTALGLFGQRVGWQRSFLFAVPVLCLVLLAVCYAYRPQGYELGEQVLIVHRSAGDIVLPIKDIRGVHVDATPFAGAIRVAGNGGLFGFWGRFYSKRLQTFTAYATRRDRGVVLDVNDRRIVLTPDDPESLAAEVARRSSLPSTGSS